MVRRSSAIELAPSTSTTSTPRLSASGRSVDSDAARRDALTGLASAAHVRGWLDDIDGDAMARLVHGQRASEPDEGGLGRGIRNLAAHRHRGTSDGGDQDDAAGAARAQVGEGGAAGEVCRVEIPRQRRVPPLRVGLID